MRFICKNRKKFNFSFIWSIALLLIGFNLNASHHFESKLAQQHPEFDLTDLYIFPSERKGFTTLMMDINPTTTKGGAKFGDNGIYSFHVASNNDLEQGVTITAYYKDNTFSFGLANGANLAVGTVGEKVGTAKVGEIKEFKNGLKVWSGAARDPFVGNSAGIIQFNKSLNEGTLDLNAFSGGVDLFAGLNTSVIVVEMPNHMLPKEVYVYATTAMYNIDKWEQVNRIANPLMTHLLLVQNSMEIAEHIGHRPDRDFSRAYEVAGRVLRAVSLDGKIKNPVKYADNVAKKFLPDVIPYVIGTKAEYSFDNINGRKPNDDAMDAVLSIFLGRQVSDNANSFDRHPKKFPYVVPLEQ